MLLFERIKTNTKFRGRRRQYGSSLFLCLFPKHRSDGTTSRLLLLGDQQWGWGDAVHEARQLISDGQFGQKLPRLMLSQNFPFVPIYQAWKSQQRQLECSLDSKQQVKQIVADVLSNQRPPYAIKGGVFDILKESQSVQYLKEARTSL